jgi:hypothetical protein
MKKFLAASMTLVLALGLAASVFASDGSYSLCYEISKGSAGGLKLKITTTALASGLSLGVTFYAPNSKDANSRIYPIKYGASTTEIDIDQKYVNGTFEAAVWTKKLTGGECDPADEFCRKNGYRMTGMVAYLWRYIISP